MYDTNVLFLSEGYVLSSIIESTIFVYGVYILFIGWQNWGRKVQFMSWMSIFIYLFIFDGSEW